MTEERVLATIAIILGAALLCIVALAVVVFFYQVWPWSLISVPVVWGAWRLAGSEAGRRWSEL